jgi:hypothetical protein
MFAVRFILNVLFTASLVLLLPKFLTLLFLLVSAVCGIGLIVYAAFFGSTMSIVTLFANFGEGAAVTDAIIALIPLGASSLIIALFLCSSVFLYLAGRSPFSNKIRLGSGGMCFASYIISSTKR